MDLQRSVLFRDSWRRVVLDEGMSRFVLMSCVLPFLLTVPQHMLFEMVLHSWREQYALLKRTRVGR